MHFDAVLEHFQKLNNVFALLYVSIEIIKSEWKLNFAQIILRSKLTLRENISVPVYRKTWI